MTNKQFEDKVFDIIQMNIANTATSLLTNTVISNSSKILEKYSKFIIGGGLLYLGYKKQNMIKFLVSDNYIFNYYTRYKGYSYLTGEILGNERLFNFNCVDFCENTINFYKYNCNDFKNVVYRTISQLEGDYLPYYFTYIYKDNDFIFSCNNYKISNNEYRFVMYIFGKSDELLKEFYNFMKQNIKKKKSISYWCQRLIRFKNKHNDIQYHELKDWNKYSFDKLFINDKTKFMKYVDKIKNKDKDFMTLLLHGLPGTGKTSIIKMLSSYLNKSIIYVKLSEVYDFNELLDILYGEKCRVNREILLNIDQSSRIIVFEDIDAECPSVLRRELYEEYLKKQEETEKEKNSKLTIEEIIKLSKQDTKEEQKIKNETKLKLGDILQLFNGIFPRNNIFMVITTNHKDKLDPALVRPGRITYDLELNEINRNTLIDMINYYYKDINRDIIEEKVKITKIIPSKLEQLIIMNEDNFEGLCKSLN
jgi:hypothetical protein